MNLPNALTSRSLTDINGQGTPSPTSVTKAPVLLTGSTAVSEPSTPPLTPTFPVTNTTNSSSPSLSISDFIPKKFMGRGAFGEVYLVQGKRSRELFALKVIRKENLRHSDYETIFEEQRIMKTVAGSDHSVHLKASFQDSDNYYILTVRHSSITLFFSAWIWHLRCVSRIICLVVTSETASKMGVVNFRPPLLVATSPIWQVTLLS